MKIYGVVEECSWNYLYDRWDYLEFPWNISVHSFFSDKKNGSLVSPIWPNVLFHPGELGSEAQPRYSLWTTKSSRFCSQVLITQCHLSGKSSKYVFSGTSQYLLHLWNWIVWLNSSTSIIFLYLFHLYCQG